MSKLTELTIKDIDSTWEEHYNKGYRYGTTIEFNTSKQGRTEVLKHLYSVLKAIPIGARANTAYLFLRGMHNGLRHIGTDSIATIMSAHFQTDDKDEFFLNKETEEALLKLIHKHGGA